MRIKKSFFIFLIPFFLMSAISLGIVTYTVEKDCKEKASIVSGNILLHISNEIGLRKKIVDNLVTLYDKGDDFKQIREHFLIESFFDNFFIFDNSAAFINSFNGRNNDSLKENNDGVVNLTRFDPKEKTFQVVYYTMNKKKEIFAGQFRTDLKDVFSKIKDNDELSIFFKNMDDISIPFLGEEDASGLKLLQEPLLDDKWSLVVIHSNKDKKRIYILMAFFFLFVFVASFHYFIAQMFFHRPFTEIREKSRNIISDHYSDELDDISLVSRSLDELNERVNSISTELSGSRNQALAFNQQLKIYRNELKYANDKLLELEKMKANFISSISHELKTPLVSIVGYTELLASKKLGKITMKQKKAFATMKRNLDRLKGIIDRLLDYSYLIDPERSLNVARVKLIDVIEDAIDSLDVKGRYEDFEIINTVTDDIYVNIDREKIQQSFCNIFDNAVKFSDDNGFIEIGVEKITDEHVFVYCKDNGVGIKKADIDHIFDRFYQADQGYTKRYGGLGLGLTIVKTIIELHGCELYIESSKGVGTIVFFSLNRSDSDK